MSYDLQPNQPLKPEPVSVAAPERIRGVYARLHAEADVAKRRRDSRAYTGKFKIPGQAPCFCGSGRKYKNCCRGREGGIL